MSENPILTIMLLLGFVVEVWVSIIEFEGGFAVQSFIAMLVAIFVLFVAYERLRDSLEEKLKVN